MARVRFSPVPPRVCARVAQLEERFATNEKAWRFESSRGFHVLRVGGRLARRSTVSGDYAGSNPVRLAILHAIRTLRHKSLPVRSTPLRPENDPKQTRVTLLTL